MGKRAKQTVVMLAIAVMLAAGGAPLWCGQALSAFFDSDEADLRICTADSRQIWRMDGDFDADRWKQDFLTGIWITSLTEDEDLWIYLEYTGDLNKVFAHQNPILLPAGKTIELRLEPLDSQDSPRILNPCNIVNPAGKWRDFNGKIKIHTLNKYATLETREINISGRTLWEVLFAQKINKNLDLQAAGDIERKSKNIMESQETAQGDSGASLLADSEGKAIRDAAEAGDYARELADYRPVQFMEQVYQVVDRVAPGLLEEHGFLLNAVSKCLALINKLVHDTEWMVGELHRLQNQVAEQRYQIEQLSEALHTARERNAVLENEVEKLQNLIKADESNAPGAGAGPEAVETGTDTEPHNTDIGPPPQGGAGTDSALPNNSGKVDRGEKQGMANNSDGETADGSGPGNSRDLSANPGSPGAGLQDQGNGALQ